MSPFRYHLSFGDFPFRFQIPQTISTFMCLLCGLIHVVSNICKCRRLALWGIVSRAGRPIGVEFTSNDPCSYLISPLNKGIFRSANRCNVGSVCLICSSLCAGHENQNSSILGCKCPHAYSTRTKCSLVSKWQICDNMGQLGP